MAVSSMFIDDILELLEGIKVDNPIHYEQWSKKYVAEAQWAIIDAETTLKLLRTLLCYISSWSDDDKGEYLVSLLAEIEAALEDAKTGLAADCAEADEHQMGDKIQAVGKFHNKIVDQIQNRVADAYDYLSRVSHPPVSDYLVFDEFVACLEAYLEILPLELDSYFEFDRWFHFLPIFFGEKSFYRERYPAYDWFPSTALRQCLETIVIKLQILRYFICNFSVHVIEKEKSQYPLACAGALVFGIAHLSCISSYDRAQVLFPQRVFRNFSGLSAKISPRNPKVTEIYIGFLEGYVEILKAAKPPSGAVSSMTVEDVVNSFLTFIFSTKNRVDILSDALAFPLLDLVMTPEDYTEYIESFLKLGITAVAVEAGSLEFSIFLNEMPGDKVRRETRLRLSEWLHRIKLIKAEIFLLELHRHRADLMIPEEDRVAGIRDSMRFLGKFLKTPEGYLEDSEKMILTLIEAVVREAGSLYTSFKAGKIMEDVMKDSSLAIFKVFKAEAMLKVLINNRSSLAFLAKYRTETFHKVVICLRALFSDVQKDNLEDAIFTTLVETMATEATSLVCSFGDKKMGKYQPIDMNLLISCLPRNIELNIAKFDAIYQQGPWSLFSSFPKSDGFGFAYVPLEELRALLTHKPDTITFMKDQVEALLHEVEFLRSFLDDVATRLNGNKDLGTRILCLIYEAEYIIDLFVAGDVPLWFHQLVILTAIEEFKLIKTRANFHNDEISSEFELESVGPTLRHKTLEASNPRTDEVIVGLDDQAKIIIDQIKNGLPKLQVISIIGMPGLGKTTLAKKIYSNDSIEYHFIVRAWCYVSQVYKKRKLLLDILGDCVELTDQVKRLDDNDLALTLKRSLREKAYLIVLDDVWSIEPWNDLKSILPDDKKGSRVLFTSRLRDVALHANPSMEPHSLPLLSNEKSWELLQGKLFHNGKGCPEELKEVGRDIAINCKGLPLAIVVVAGLLKRPDMNAYWWEEVAQSLRSRLSHGQERQFMDILELSYNHLPMYLKPCFLYLGAFLEDQEIPVSKLKWLWIAEGFVPKVDSKSSEETAEDYLVDLIGRSLVMEAKRRSKGGTKTCRMHDMLRDLCLKKAREENFMQLISTHHGCNSQSYYPSDFVASMHYRLCVHSSKAHFMQSIPFGPHVHSLLYFSTSNSETRRSYDISFICAKFKLLRVLDLESVTIGQSFPREIEFMFRLSYLAVRGNINSIPSSIAILRSLETLIVKGMKGEVVLPDTIWSMAKLRHVQVDDRVSFPLPRHENRDSRLLDYLVTLSSPVLSYGQECKEILRRLIGLRKLRCIFLEPWDNYKKCSLFPVMDILTQLESLKVFYHGSRLKFPCEFSFPLNLKKLTLSCFCLPWEYISAIRRLRNLEVLKLLFRAFEGETWDMTEGEFSNLKYLKLANLNIANWNASSDHFPNLQQLVLQSCKKLKEVPSCFGEICTLQIIEVLWCSAPAAKSVGIVLEQQLDMGNEEFKVSINPPEWDFRTSSQMRT